MAFFFQIWNVHSVLNVLYSLVEKSKINHQVCLIAPTTPTKKIRPKPLLNNLSRDTTVPLQMQITSICLSEASVKSKINRVTESNKYMKNEYRNKHQKDRWQVPKWHKQWNLHDKCEFWISVLVLRQIHLLVKCTVFRSGEDVCVSPYCLFFFF